MPFDHPITESVWFRKGDFTAALSNGCWVLYWRSQLIQSFPSEEDLARACDGISRPVEAWAPIRKEAWVSARNRITCPKCGHTWEYKGQSRHYATCPDCHQKVNLAKARGG